MMEEIRTVHIGPHTVEVEVNPDDFKRPAIMWVPAMIGSVALGASGYWLLAVVASVVGLVALAVTKMAGRSAMDAAIRRAAIDSIPRYEQSRIIGYKSMG